MRILLCALLFLFSYTTVSAEEIASFRAQYEIQDSGLVSVKETVVYDFGNESRHGMYRTLSTNHPQASTDWYKNRLVAVEDIVVMRDGKQEDFSTSEFAGTHTIKIGHEDRTITGQHTYTIAYTLRGALSYGDMGAEFYWNATGDEWEVSILKAAVEVRGEMQTGTTSCYEGYRGSTEACADSSFLTPVAYFESGQLDSDEGLTIATALDPQKVAFLTYERVTILIPLMLGFLWTLGFGIYLWRWRRASKPDLPVIAQYEPYNNYLPVYTGVLVDSSLDDHDIAAGIIYLAEQGFINIKQIEKKVLWLFTNKDYEFTLKREIEECSVPMLQTILRELIFSLNTEVGAVSLLSDIAKRQVLNAKVVQKLKTEAIADLRKDGFLEPAWTSAPKVIFIMLAFHIGLYILSWSLIVVICFFCISGVMLIFANSYRRNSLGYIALNHIQGFKLFLSVTDKERFTFHNAPDKSPKLFMKYLPYAIALKVEKEWAEAFKDITLTNPAWYSGANTFTAMAFASELSNFGTALASSSGISGSSGGGSSGGGGGGGGGGSW